MTLKSLSLLLLLLLRLSLVRMISSPPGPLKACGVCEKVC
jgi:hypothetical protein